MEYTIRMINETVIGAAQGAVPTVSIGNYLTHLDETKRGLAKLLARENITVTHAHVPTAMFNIETRELVLPKFDKVTVDQYDLLIGHEVGHAKHSQDLQVLKDCIEFPGLKTYVNVLEDTRIERLMKAEYPGLRGSFRRGYADFATFGPLFQLEQPVEAYSFIDRINLQYKIGASVAVPFSKDEAAVLPRIDALSSFRAVYVLAKELWESDKAAAQDAADAERGQQGPNGEPSGESTPDAKSSGEGAGAGESKSSDAKSSDAGKSKSSDAGDAKSSDAKSSDDAGDAAGDAAGDDAARQETAAPTTTTGPHHARDAGGPVARTDVANDAALQAAANVEEGPGGGVTQVQLSPLSAATVAKHTISNAQFVSDIATYCDAFAGVPGAPALMTYGESYLTAFNAKHDATIRFMVREFELRKAAKMANRAKTSRTGRLDVSKLYAYKFREDLFKSVITTPNGQSHGIVVLIDTSGSMKGVMSHTIDQALLFGSFAKQAGIPFRAMTFTTSTGFALNTTRRSTVPLDEMQNGTLVPTEDTKLVTILDTTAPNWKAQMRAVALLAATIGGPLGAHTAAVPHSRLGMTPLLSALLLVDDAIATMKAAHRLDKMTLLVVTDGDDSDGVVLQTPNSHRHVGGYRGHPLHIRDTVTRKQYADYAATPDWDGRPYYRASHTAVLAALVDSLRTRHSARVVSIRLVGGRELDRAATRAAKHNHARRTLWSNYGKSFVAPQAEPSLHVWRDETEDIATLKSTGQLNWLTKDVVGDAVLIVSTARLNMTPETIERHVMGTDAATTRNIIKQFVTQNIKASRNKVFVNTVIPYLA